MLMLIMIICIALALFLNIPLITILANGSTTVLPLLQNLAQDWENGGKHNTPIAVSGGGSGLGISNLMNKACDLGDASRYANNEEYTSNEWKSLYTCPIAIDSLMFATQLKWSSNEPITLTVSDINGIYSNKITNWSNIKEPEGLPPLPNKKINVLNRIQGSGTRDAFYNALSIYSKIDKFEAANGKENINNEINANSNGQIIFDLLSNKSSIGYFSLGYLQNLFNSDHVTPKNFNIHLIKVVDNYKDLSPIILPPKSVSNNNLIKFINSISQSIYTGTNSKIFNAFWHPMNIIVNSNNSIWEDSNNNLRIKSFIKWIYDEKTQNSIINYGYLPIYNSWINGEKKYPVFENEVLKLKSHDEWLKWLFNNDDVDKNKVFGDNKTWWSNWIGQGIYK